MRDDRRESHLMWDELADWMATDWYPRAHRAGLRHHAVGSTVTFSSQFFTAFGPVLSFMKKKPATPAAAPPRAAKPAHQAPTDTPEYGHFGYATGHGEGPPAPPTVHDEMAKLRPNRVPQRGHVTQNQDVAAVQAAHNGTEAAMRASYARDDPRYAGGDLYDLSDEQTTR